MGQQSAAQRRAAAKRVAEAQAKEAQREGAAGAADAAGAAGAADRIAAAAEGTDVPTDAFGNLVGPSERELQLEAQLAALEEQLARSRQAAVEPSLPAPETTAVVTALEAVTATLRGMQEAQEASARASAGSFREHESPGSVEASLRGSVTTGDHSGRYADHFVTFEARGVRDGRGSNFNVVRKARHRFVDASGEAVVTPGVHYDFAPTGHFVTDDLEVIEYLKRRPGFNLEFWELGEEPGGAPSAEPVLDRIMEARIEMDVEALDAIEHEERAGHGRPQVLQGVEAARRSIRKKADELGVSA